MSSRCYLSNYGPRYRGIDVNRLLDEMEQCCAELIAGPEETPRVKVVPRLLPKLQLGP